VRSGDPKYVGHSAFRDLASPDELSPSDVCAWRELAAQAVEPNPFFEPEFVLAAVRNLHEQHVRVLTVKDRSGDWLACMPVCARVRVRDARAPGLSAWRNLYAFLGTPLVHRDAVEQGTERLLESALHRSRLGVLVLPQLGDDGPVATALLAALASHRRHVALHQTHERAVLHHTTVADGLGALMSSRHRRDLRRLGRRLGEELGGTLELRDESDSEAAVNGFLTLEAAGWKGARGTGMACRPAHAAFFRELCAGFRALGRLQIFALASGERTVSYACNVIAGDAMFQFKIAFDETFGHYRPGLQLEVHLVEWLRDQLAVRWIDSCAAADSPLFKNFWPERRPIGSYVIATNRAIGWGIDHGATHLLARRQH
jgi:CelD/BcsL family acetyltransferase involved in cellulose biosynthesis